MLSAIQTLRRILNLRAIFLYHKGEWLLKALIPAIDPEIASPIRLAMHDTPGVEHFYWEDSP